MTDNTIRVTPRSVRYSTLHTLSVTCSTVRVLSIRPTTGRSCSLRTSSTKSQAQSAPVLRLPGIQIGTESCQPECQSVYVSTGIPRHRTSITIPSSLLRLTCHLLRQHPTTYIADLYTDHLLSHTLLVFCRCPSGPGLQSTFESDRDAK